MTTNDLERPLDEVNRIGLESLISALGAADAERFLDHCRTGVKDYTEERHKWLDRLSREEVLQSIKAIQREGLFPNGSDGDQGTDERAESSEARQPAEGTAR